MGKKLKILAAGDLHGSLSVAERLAKKGKREKVDLVVLAGDIFGYEKEDVEILEPFIKRGQRVVFVPGNCDFDEDLEKLKDGKNLHGRYVCYGDVGIAGIGNGNWKLWLENEDFKLINEVFSKIKSKKKILVSHLHARGTRAELFGFEGWEGDDVLRHAIEKVNPDILISAHIHEAEGIEDIVKGTRIIQVGRNGSILEV